MKIALLFFENNTPIYFSIYKLEHTEYVYNVQKTTLEQPELYGQQSAVHVQLMNGIFK